MTTETTTRNSAREEESALLLQNELAEGLKSEVGLRAEWANEWAARLTNFLRLRLGAQQIYVPAPSKSVRDAAIYREFDGTNAAAVMRRHGVSRSRLYQIIEEQRLLQRAGLGGDSPVSSLKTGQAGG